MYGIIKIWKKIIVEKRNKKRSIVKIMMVFEYDVKWFKNFPFLDYVKESCKSEIMFLTYH